MLYLRKPNSIDMKNILSILVLIIILFSCKPNKNVLVLLEDADHRYGYLNTKGDTVISFGKYDMCFTDTIKNFGIVLDKKLGFIGIDTKENVLFKVYVYDNGPDYIEEGLFRIVKNSIRFKI